MFETFLVYDIIIPNNISCNSKFDYVKKIKKYEETKVCGQEL